MNVVHRLPWRLYTDRPRHARLWLPASQTSMLRTIFKRHSAAESLRAASFESTSYTLTHRRRLKIRKGQNCKLCLTGLLDCDSSVVGNTGRSCTIVFKIIWFKVWWRLWKEKLHCCSPIVCFFTCDFLERLQRNKSSNVNITFVHALYRHFYNTRHITYTLCILADNFET